MVRVDSNINTNKHLITQYISVIKKKEIGRENFMGPQRVYITIFKNDGIFLTISPDDDCPL